MRRGEIETRFDCNYWASTRHFNDRYAAPRYPLGPLGENAAVVQYGCSDLANDDGRGLRMVRMNNLQDDEWDFTDVKRVPLGLREARRYRLQRGDLLFNRTNSKELVGKCGVFDEKGVWVFASYLIRVRLNESKLLPQFAALFLNSPAGRIQIDRVSRQIIGMTNVNAEELRELIIPLPPVPKQRELVAVMEAAREARRAKLAEADALLSGMDGFLLDALGLALPPTDGRNVFAVRQKAVIGTRCDSQFHHPHYTKVLATLAACPHPKISVSELSPQIVGGATPTRGDADLYANSGIRFLRILNVKPNEIDFSDMKFIQPHVHQGELERSQLAADDVLMTITGRVGTAAVVTDDALPANINQHLVRLRLNTARCLPDFLAAFLNSATGLTLSNRGVTGGTRIALDYETIRQLQIPLPPMAIQTAIGAEIRRRRERARVLRAEAEQGWMEARRRFEEQLLGPVPQQAD